jgi:type IV pilus assembly protein PilN
LIRINLLPHREMRRERRKKDFIGLLALMAIAAAGIAFVVGLGINQQISAQNERNEFIKVENAKLDTQIKEIATLRQEIDALKARQQAVENLQGDRTIPVHLMDELVKYTPEGIYLKQIKQEDRKVLLVGYAQSNERVSELLRNLASQTTWLERPELIEIKSATLGSAGTRDSKSIFEFSLTALVKGRAIVPVPGVPRKTAAVSSTPQAAGPLASNQPAVK